MPPHNGVIGAIGMALIARERMKDSGKVSRFRGYDLGRVNFTTREFVCQACSNYCDMKEFNIEGQRTYWGDKCSDKFRKRARTDRQPVIEDLIDWREKLLEEALLPTRGGRWRVGIPRHRGHSPFRPTSRRGLRLSYASLNPDEATEAVRRLRRAANSAIRPKVFAVALTSAAAIGWSARWHAASRALLGGDGQGPRRAPTLSSNRSR